MGIEFCRRDLCFELNGEGSELFIPFIGLRRYEIVQLRSKRQGIQIDHSYKIKKRLSSHSSPVEVSLARSSTIEGLMKLNEDYIRTTGNNQITSEAKIYHDRK